MTSATWSSSGRSAPTPSATLGSPSMMSGTRSWDGSVMAGLLSRRRSAIGDTRRSIGRATPSPGSMCHPGHPSNHPPPAIGNLRRSLGLSNATFAWMLSPISSRSNLGRIGSSANRSCISVGSSRTRRPTSAAKSSAASSPRISTAGCRALPLSNRARMRSASRSAVGLRFCHDSATDGSIGARSSGSSAVTVSPPGRTSTRNSIDFGALTPAGGSQAPIPLGLADSSLGAACTVACDRCPCGPCPRCTRPCGSCARG